MASIRAVIVDDEPASTRRLQTILGSAPGLEVVGVAADGRAGFELVRSTGADLVFLDIRMPEMDGLEVAEALAGNRPPAVIFTTAFADFAVSAFDLGAFDYVLKPVEAGRVLAAVERARERLRTVGAEERSGRLESALRAIREPEADETGPLQWLWVVDGRGRTRLDVDSIERFEAERDYVRVHAGDRSYLIRATLQSIAERLDPGRFARAHRSLVVNLDAVRSLRRRLTGAMVATLQSGAEAPVGRVYLAEFKARLRLPLRAAE